MYLLKFLLISTIFRKYTPFLQKSPHSREILSRILKTETTQKFTQLYLSKPATIKHKAIFELPQQNFDTDKSLYLEFRGYSQIEISLFNIPGQVIDQATFQINKTREIYTIPIAPQLLKKIPAGKIIIQVSNLPPLSQGIYMEVVQKPFIQMKFNTNVQIFPAFAQEIQIRVFSPEKVASTKYKNRLQFLLFDNFKDQNFSGDEQIAMFINEGEKFPTESDFQFNGKIGFGYNMVSLINSNNHHFCVKKGCVYSLVIKALNMQSIAFTPMVVFQGQVYDLQDELVFYGKLPVKQEITYEINFKDDLDANVLFQLEPFENNPNFYVNLDTKPASYEESQFKATADGIEQILVTKEQAAFLKTPMKKFYVTIVSNNSQQLCTYIIRMIKQSKFSFNTITQSQINSGILVPTQKINFHMFLKPQNNRSETFNMRIQLDIKNQQNAELFIKECEIGEYKSCQLTDKDIERTLLLQPLQDYSEKIFYYNSSKKSNQQQTQQKLSVVSLDLNFNCSGSVYNIDHFPNSYPISKSCIFVVAVRNPVTQGSIVEYQLSIQGLSRINELKLRESKILTIHENSQLDFKTVLSDQQLQKFSNLLIKMVLLTGKASFSTYSGSNRDAIKSTELSPTKGSLVQTQQFIQEIPLLQNKEIYFSVKAHEFTLLDLYVDVYNDFSQLFGEYISLNKSHDRTIKRDSLFKIQQNAKLVNVYFKSFVYEINSQQVDKNLYINLNTETLGLVICVQRNTKTFDQKKDCDFKSNSEQLVIRNSDVNFQVNQFYSISIQKRISQDQIFHNFPINFSITISNEQENTTWDIRSGKIYVDRLLTNQTKQLKFSLQNLSEDNYAGIYFTSAGKLRGKLFAVNDLKNEIVDNLDNENHFGVFINDAPTFKQLHCKQKLNPNCEFILKLKSRNKGPVRFNVVLQVNQEAIHLKDGYTISVPSNFKNYFLVLADQDQPVNFSYVTTGFKMQAYSKIFDQEESYNGNPFWYKVNELSYSKITDLERKNMIVYKKDSFKNYRPPLLAFYLKEGTKEPMLRQPGTPIVVLKKKWKCEVTVKNQVQLLTGYHLTKSELQKGTFEYFYILLDSKDNFSILMNVFEGEADLYINPGMYNLTTTQNYWKKSDTYKGDELNIKQQSSTNSDNTAAYTIGVYAKENSNYQILFAPRFNGIINVEDQQLYSLDLRRYQSILFSFINPGNKHSVYIYSDRVDVEIDVVDDDELSGLDMIDIIYDKKYRVDSFKQKANFPPIQKQLKPVQNKEASVLVHVKGLRGVGKINFLVFEENQPIEVLSNTQFEFSLKKLQKQVFKVKLNSDYNTVKIAIQTLFGEIQYAVSDDPDEIGTYESIPAHSLKNFTYKDKNLTKDVIFKNIYIHIAAVDFSAFKIYTNSKNQFHRLSAFETEIFDVDKQNPTYAYFRIPQQKTKEISNLRFDIYQIRSIDNKPILQFVSETSHVVLDEHTNFIPMPIQDYQVQSQGEYDHFIIHAKVFPGKYVFKFEPFPNYSKVRISVNINNQVQVIPNLKLNAYLEDELIFRSQFPKGGSVRLGFDICKNVGVLQTEYYTVQKGSSAINYKNYSEINHFYVIDSKQDQELFDPMLYSVKRNNYEIDILNPGILTFHLTIQDLKNRTSNELVGVNLQYKEDNKQLFFKEYINYREEDKMMITMGWDGEPNQQQNKFQVKFMTPLIISQLFQDYPSVKGVKMTFLIKVLSNINSVIEKAHECGFDMVTSKNSQKVVMSKFLTKEMILEDQQNLIEGVIPTKIMQLFENEQQIYFVASVGIQFVNDIQKDFLTSLNAKFVQIPYFIYTYNSNKEPRRANRSVLWIIILLGSLCLLVLVGYFGFWYCQKRKMQKVPGNSEMSFGQQADSYSMESSQFTQPGTDKFAGKDQIERQKSQEEIEI